MYSKDPVNKCHKCGDTLKFEVKIGRRDMCPNCYAYLHCCKNCKFWDESVHNECKENRAEFIRDREEGNFCLYFTFNDASDESEDEAQKAKEKLQAMFGGSSMDPGKKAPQTADDAKKRLEELFKK